jgi:protein O-mannosyl-transferase
VSRGTSRRGRGLFAAVLVAAITVIAYWPSLSVPFQFDDYARISGNMQLRAGNWTRAIGQLGGARVLPASTLVFNYWLSGDETRSYHVVNLAVHLAATGAVFWLALLLARAPRLSASRLAGDPLFFAAAAAAFFACHPLQTQAVTYIIQRAAAMAAMFYLACVGAYLAGRLAQDRHGAAAGRRYFAMALLCAAAALLSKENAVTLPLAVLLVEVACFGRRHVGRLLRVGLLATPFLAIPIVWKIATWGARGDATSGGSLRRLLDAVFAQGMESPPAVGFSSYLLTQMLVVPRYLRLLLLPVGLNVDHDVRVATGLDAAVFAGAVLLLALLALGLWALRRAPLIGFGILWLFIALSVESSLIPIHDVMMEHRMYLAMPGPALLFAAGLVSVRRRHRRLAASALVGCAVLLAAMTFARNQVWQSALGLWSDAAAKSPNKARVHVNVGVAHHGRDELDAAIRHYCRAIEIDPDIALARDNIEIALEQQGRLDDVLARLRPRRVAMPGAPAGAVVLEYDPSEVVCEHAGE